MVKTRHEKLLHYIDPGSQIGVEIGPLTNPVVTRDMGTVYYIDHATTEELREKYAKDTSVDISKIVDVDYVWGEKNLAELTQVNQPFDYLIASHVIEHVPDLIGWLQEIRSILKLGGILSLAIPDKRQCFDYKRQTTRTSDVFEAYLHHRKKPSPRQIFDYLASVVHIQGSYTWGDKVNDSTEFIHFYSLQDAQEITKSVFESGAYYDVHCWVFTPHSFFKLLGELIELGLLKFEVVQFYETTGCEFFVTLRAIDHPTASSFALPEPEVKKQLLLETLSEENEYLRKQLKDKEQEQQELAKAADQERHARSHLHECIKAMESSKFWQMRAAWFKLKRLVGLS